ncbi:MAG: polysaccharide pyruvyl transferase family protein [Clostridia bacterium]|nr:polysaccharide pyruvyl transferase family protein [Clostridia bacterium]
MKKVSTVTFHKAQNYGSVLQTYALQEFVKTLANKNGQEVNYSVVNVEPKAQKGLYSIYKKGLSVTNLVKNTVAFFNQGKLKSKQKKFNSFLNNYINLTDRYDTIESLYANTPNSDYFISGSDQIWNVRSCDFEDYFYLDFACNAKKISYAASFGPLKINWEKYNKEKYAKLLNEYSYISTREEGSAKNVELLTGKTPEIHVDPTLLLDKEDFRKIQSNANYRNGKYILLYCLEPSKKQLKIVKQISKKLRLPVVITKYNNKNDIFNTFVKKYDCGPCDFLSLIDNAEMVITSSFHGTAFSLIYRKKFYVLNGKTDNRISDILSKTNLLDRSIESEEELDNVNLNDVDFTKANEFLLNEKLKSANYLEDALELK